MNKAIQRISLAIVPLALAASVIWPGCSGSGGTGVSDLRLLEDLESRASLKDPAERVEALERFAARNKDHPLREDAYVKVFETLAGDSDDLAGATAYLDGILAGEKDPAIRGSLYFAKFRYIYKGDSLAGLRVVDDALDGGERDYSMLLYMAYYLMGGKENPTTDRVFEELIRSAGKPVREDHARTLYAEYLEKNGHRDNALDQLEKASDYTFACESIGRLMLEDGRPEKAVEAYIRLAAGAPGYRERVKLDSLYASVHPGADDLDKRIAEKRVFEGDVLPDMEFIDIQGRFHRISDYRGRFLVISAFSPT